MMTSEAKRTLSTTIRGLRTYLLDALHSETEQAYRLSIADPRRADLREAALVRRARLDAWVEEQRRAGRGGRDATERFRKDAIKQAAYTLLNRMIVLRLLEAGGLSRVPVVTGAWEARGFKDFRELAPALVHGDRSEGYGYLLELLFEELAAELPGLFGAHGVTTLIPVPADTWRHVVEKLDDPQLGDCWTDDMTLGWVYQYWNDPEREALDAKLHARGKLEPHEIASKTQMFTERYMVDWLLQNSLGPMWLAMCHKHGWTPEAVADGTLARLEARRVKWRAMREAKEVALTELMPLETDAERRWAYYVEQPIPADAVTQAPETVRELKILDPAVGSGHFLVVAFDLLAALYREEARHRGEADDARWSEKAIVEHILEHNLHGIDLDPRAVQIAAAALWFKAKQTCAAAEPAHLNLVASNLRLGSLSETDPALEELRVEVERETGIPAALTNTILKGLRDADHLGSLLRVDKAIEDALEAHEKSLPPQTTGELFAEPLARPRAQAQRRQVKATILDRLEAFLKRHTKGEDLGLRLRGEQLAAGVRFVRINRELRYDLVVGNPPYQGTAKMAETTYVDKNYVRGKPDLYAGFLERGLQLVRYGGVFAMLILRNWMFIKQYYDMRKMLLGCYDLRALGDFDRGAFEDIQGEVVSVVGGVIHRARPRRVPSLALQPTPFDDRSCDVGRTQRKRSATLVQLGKQFFEPASFVQIKSSPIVYDWPPSLLEKYLKCQLMEVVAPARSGVATGDDIRFFRRWYEVATSNVYLNAYHEQEVSRRGKRWVPVIAGAKGQQWVDSLTYVMIWSNEGCQLRVWISEGAGGTLMNMEHNFVRGVAFSAIGHRFFARAHRYRSVFSSAGPSLFPKDIGTAVCSLNSDTSRRIISSFNPGINFKGNDVNRAPLLADCCADKIFAQVEQAFGEHEAHREPSVEFRCPGPSPWPHAQAWAQQAVDRPEGAPLPSYAAELDPEPATDHLSYALGVALGRFGGKGEGLRDPAREKLDDALPAGILFLDTTLTEHDRSDGLGHRSTAMLRTAWERHGAAIAPKQTLRDYLAGGFFEVHRRMYDNRPIHWPLSSEKRTFVAWITIHRWTDNTLRTLLADHLQRRLTRLVGELTDLRAACDGGDRKAARAAEKRFAQVQKWREELMAFIAAVEQCAEKGPPPVDGKCPGREVDARYVPDLDDGVMINSAALWPLLAPQWKDPKKWWRELACADPSRDYDWSHLAMRYWPARVDDKCLRDPSYAVAHGCFWRHHPDRAWAWELRLQDELGGEFRLVEGGEGDRVLRSRFVAERGEEALRLVKQEVLRRLRKHRRPVEALMLHEPGLWKQHPAVCWALEEAVIRKQRAPFSLGATDEPRARRAFAAAHPDEVARRAALLRAIEQKDMFEKTDDSDDDPELDELDDEDAGAEEESE